MTDPDSSYRPRSPDFTSLQPFPDSFNNTYQPQPPYLASPHGQRASYDASPFFNSGYQPPVPAASSRIPQQYVQPTLPPDYSFDMARRSARLSAGGQPPAVGPHQTIMFDHPVATLPPAPIEESKQPKPWEGVEVKTKFPVARIKRIMQADEEVGKVAQVTPIAVCTFSSFLLRYIFAT
jgi:hypothetical protein